MRGAGASRRQKRHTQHDGPALAQDNQTILSIPRTPEPVLNRPSATARLSTAFLLVAAAFPAVQAQTVLPDSGSIPEKPRVLPTLPAPGAPAVRTQEFKRAFVGSNVQLTPAAFSFTGNTVFTSAELQPLVAGFAGKATDLNGLLDAVTTVRNFYRAKGYLLTEVYIPEQSFAATGGTVELAVVEARIGRVRVDVKPGAGVSQGFAENLLANHLRPGDPITEYSLDKPILLLRDTVRVDASASVVPGEATGLADIVVEVMPQGKFIDGSVALDNQGAVSAGEYRLTGTVNLNAPLGIGDQLSIRLQPTDNGNTRQYRFAYGAPINGWGTKATLSYSVNDYGLRNQFAALKATGSAKVTSFSLIHPVLRGRKVNVFVQGGFDHKQLDDTIGQTGNEAAKKIDLFRLGVLGNYADEFLFAGGFNSFAVTYANGKLDLDPSTATSDSQTTGPQTAGRFSKVNIELQRVQYFSDATSLLLGANMQFASKNLTSAEKMSLGGPTGVRGYPIGEANGDEGILITLELRHMLGFQLLGSPVSITGFYDYGTVKVDKIRSATVNSPAVGSGATLGPSRLSIDSLGLGFYAGIEGRLLLSGGMAVRAGGPVPTTGDADRKPRLYFSAQKWF